MVPQFLSLVNGGMEKTAHPFSPCIKETQEFAIVNSLDEFGVGREFFHRISFLEKFGILPRGEEQGGPSLEKDL
jgi:hypothetical protein